jgi:hypothetical protein
VRVTLDVCRAVRVRLRLKVLTVLLIGLHLTPDGYRVLFHEVMATVSKIWPDQLPENLPMVLPAWDNLESWKDL